MAVIEPAARRFLASQPVAHLATASATGAPHVMPVCFGLVGDTAYVAIDEKPKTDDVLRLRRLRNIAANPTVALVADRYDDHDWSRLAWVLLRGTARIVVPPGDEHALALVCLRDKYPQYRAMALEARPVIAIDVARSTSWGALA